MCLHASTRTHTHVSVSLFLRVVYGSLVLYRASYVTLMKRSDSADSNMVKKILEHMTATDLCVLHFVQIKKTLWQNLFLMQTAIEIPACHVLKLLCPTCQP